MHDTALINARRFFDSYIGERENVTVVDIGAQDVNGSLRAVTPANARYIGVDFIKAEGVDVVLDDSYTLPFEDNSVDVIPSSSCFEHSEFFWILFLEVLRILKPDGLFYLNVPSNGVFHRYPVDCWRFYPDSGIAKASWGQKNGFNTTVLESYTSSQKRDVWNDFVCVFLKDQAFSDRYPDRIITGIANFTNGLSFPELDKFINYSMTPEDQRRQYFKRIRNKLLRAFGAK